MSATDAGLCLISPGWAAPHVLAPGSPATLGGGAASDLQVAGDGVADPHCRIEWQDDLPVLVALDGAATTCNGAAVRRQPLVDGDEIGLGAGGRVRVRLQPSSGSYARLAPSRCRQCGNSLTEAESARGGRYRSGASVLCLACVRGGAGTFPEVVGLRLAHKLGGGVNGQVFEAFDAAGERLAVKLLHLVKENAEKLAYRYQRFQREVELSWKLRHPSILRTHRSGRDGNQIYLIMDYVDGLDLARRLAARGRPYDPPDVLDLLRRVADALDYAHRHQVVHRDIKPANVIIADDGDVKLTDFGLARNLLAESRLTRAGSVLGTVPYASPEQLHDSRSVGIPADVYSLAATAYCLFAGRPPFSDPNQFKLLLQVKDEPPLALSSIRPELPAALCDAVMAGLAKQPERRPASAGELVEAMFS